MPLHGYPPSVISYSPRGELCVNSGWGGELQDLKQLFLKYKIFTFGEI